MLQVIVSSNTNTRINLRSKILNKKDSITAVDDLNTSFFDLEQYLYPSLFSEQNPVVHAKYLIEEYPEQVTKDFIIKLVLSPTIFILEENDLSLSIVKLIEKNGGLVFFDKVKSSLVYKNTIFSVTNAITNISKKDRWMAYQLIRKEHPAEALIGILYWKLKDLIQKTPSKSSYFKGVYTKLINAHKNSWQSGFSLDLAIEKVILEC